MQRNEVYADTWQNSLRTSKHKYEQEYLQLSTNSKIGHASEEGIEARHKDLCSARLHHTCKSFIGYLHIQSNGNCIS